MSALPALGMAAMLSVGTGRAGAAQQPRRLVALPAPRREGTLSVETALQRRRSVREYSRDPLTLDQVSQLLWAAQGITTPDGLRTAPSAGALYPLELYLVTGNVRDLAAGIYKYRPREHDLLPVGGGDRRDELAAAALGQSCVSVGAAVIVIVGVYERTASKYGERATRYVHMEVGHAAQNVYLQAIALDLATVFVGAFRDSAVVRVLNLPAAERPLGLMPVGHEK